MSVGIQGKLIITAQLKLVTGLHIGSGGDFSAIGAVDKVVVRDPLTKLPIIPGSSLKGKLRSLLARIEAGGYQLQGIKADSPELKRLFGASEPPVSSRLQFYDLFLSAASQKSLENMDTDLYLTEIKFENTINRVTCVANPRQIERVPAGGVFDFKLVYTVEDLAEITEDLQKLADGIKLLTYDYLGGHGSRGYGKIVFGEFKVEPLDLSRDKNLTAQINIEELEKILNGAMEQ